MVVFRAVLKLKALLVHRILRAVEDEVGIVSMSTREVQIVFHLLEAINQVKRLCRLN